MKFLYITIILFYALTLQAEDIAVVASSKFNSNTVEKVELKRLFLAKTNRIHNSKVKVMELVDTSCKETFYKKISNKTQSQLRAYWSRLIFTGKAKPHKQVKSLDALLSKMAENASIISYVPLSMVSDKMKVLYMLEN